MNPVLIIENPSAGRRRHTSVAQKMSGELLQHGIVSEILTLGDRELRQINGPERYSACVVVGGDGTVRSVVQYLAEQQLALPIAILHRGSGNIVAKSLRMPRSVQKLAQLIKTGKTRQIDIARLDSGEYFVAAVAVGYLSARVAATPQRIKKLLGFGGYLVSFAQQRRLPEHTFTFSVDGTAHAIRGHSLFIVNATRLFGLHARRSNGMDDGAFELGVTVNKSFWSIPRALTDFYVRKKTPRHLALFRGTHFTLQCDEHPSLLLDGEILRGNRPVTISVVPRAQSFFSAA